MKTATERGNESFMAHFRNLSLITFASRISGLFREMAKAYFLGVGVTNDAFTIAFAIPNLFRRLTAEGATLGAFVPSLSEVDKKEGKKGLRTFFSGFFAWYAIVLFGACSVFILFADFLAQNVFAPGFDAVGLEMTGNLMKIMFFYLLFISLSALVQGVLNYYDQYRLSAFTPILLNFSIIACAWAFSFFFENRAYGFSIGVIVGGVFQLGIQLFWLLRFFRFDFRLSSLAHPQIGKTLSYIVPGIFGAGIYQINIVIGNAIASSLGEGAVSALAFSNRLLEFALGVFVVSITTVLLPQLSKLATRDEHGLMSEKITDSLLLTGFLTLPATVVLAVNAKEIMQILFGYGAFDEKAAEMCAQALFAHSFGLFFIGCNRVLTTTLQSAKFFRTVVKIAFVVMLVNLSACYGLSLFLGHVGIAYANSASQAFQFILMLVLAGRKLKFDWLGKRVVVGFSKQVACAFAVAMFFLVLERQNAFSEVSIYVQTPVSLLLAAAVFLVFAKALKIRELDSILKAILRKKKK